MLSALLVLQVLAPVEKMITPFAVIQGAKTTYASPSQFIIRDQVEWNQMWAKHKGYPEVYTTGTKAAPKYDFKKYALIAIFLGPKDNCRGLVFTTKPYGLYAREKDLILRYRPNHRWEPAVGKPDMPFAFIVVPKVGKKTLFIEEDNKDTEFKELNFVEKAKFNLN
jgi:hypothetical protein